MKWEYHVIQTAMTSDTDWRKALISKLNELGWQRWRIDRFLRDGDNLVVFLQRPVETASEYMVVQFSNGQSNKEVSLRLTELGGQGWRVHTCRLNDNTYLLKRDAGFEEDEEGPGLTSATSFKNSFLSPGLSRKLLGFFIKVHLFAALLQKLPGYHSFLLLRCLQKECHIHLPCAAHPYLFYHAVD